MIKSIAHLADIHIRKLHRFVEYREVFKRLYKKLEYHKPNKIYKYNNPGELYNINTDDLNISTTLNHRMYIKEDDNTWKIELAENLIGKMVKYKKKPH